ncbi:hypothetical protein ANCCEY_02570 [Ancylostoma ceylanicum]|uniref:RRM domain-containing protein n=1 Tax=Ancylostoma ceylanicum TaxID=53326 RepID=A0A0D6M282_9BILA|nr:hypothetical protein ANCCEY_02570 [Ancylostoma ceylanicum]
MKTPAPKSNQKEIKSALKSGKGTDVKKSVDVSAAATPATSSKKIPEETVVKPASKKENAAQPKKVDSLAATKKIDGVKSKLDQSAVVDEENKRRLERDERSLFIKGFPKNTKTKDLEALHADIESVRHRKGTSFAWFVFRTEASCKKAHSMLSAAKIDGKPLFVDFCGSKSAKAGTVQKEQKPINPLELYINGLPPMVTKDDIKNVFRAAVSIHIPNARPHELKRAFIMFSSEEDAKSAFDKGKGLKLAGRSVEVFYARIRPDTLQSSPVKPAKNAQTVKPTNEVKVKKTPVAAKNDESDSDEDDSDEEEIESSDEGIEEVVAKPSAKAALNKRCLSLLAFARLLTHPSPPQRSH